MTDEIFTGSLISMFAEAATRAQFKIEPALWERGYTSSEWLVYEGFDCSPFKAYIRFGKNSITLAALIGTGYADQEKVIRIARMPKIVHAASAVHKRVVIESVISQPLILWLQATGFTQPDRRIANFEKDFTEDETT